MFIDKNFIKDEKNLAKLRDEISKQKLIRFAYTTLLVIDAVMLVMLAFQLSTNLSVLFTSINVFFLLLAAVLLVVVKLEHDKAIIRVNFICTKNELEEQLIRRKFVNYISSARLIKIKDEEFTPRKIDKDSDYLFESNIFYRVLRYQKKLYYFFPNMLMVRDDGEYFFYDYKDIEFGMVEEEGKIIEGGTLIKEKNGEVTYVLWELIDGPELEGECWYDI